MRTIGVVSVARSDYGIYRPVLRELAARNGTHPVLFAGGSHLLERFGRSIVEVEQDGFEIAERVDFLLDDDAPAAVAESTGRGVVAFAQAFERSRPDLLLVLGDRFEMFAAVAAALPLRIPVAHLHGGELTEGALDDAIRHAITKLSHLHFVATETYAARVRQLGEEPWRVVVSGAPAIDAIVTADGPNERELRERFGVSFERPTLLVTFHPETQEPERTVAHAEEVLAAVAASGYDAIATYPNADAANAHIAQLLEQAAARDSRLRLVKNFGADAYYGVLRRVAAMVGNSSSGILEAPSFRLPVVNVGSRQDGRLRAANVIDVEPERSAVEAAIARAVSPEFRRGLNGLVNPYGDGKAAGRIADVLESVPIDDRLLVKRWADV
jgi:UDP-N-acetylglucosamine 2-epimerase (non-hydrolysing)